MKARELLRETGDALFPAPTPNRSFNSVQSTHTLRKGQAWALVLGGYTLMFGLGVWVAIGMLLDPNFRTGISATGWTAFSLFQILVLVGITMVLRRWSGVTLGDLGLRIPCTRERLWLEAKTGAYSQIANASAIVFAVLLAITLGLPQPAYPATLNENAMDWTQDLLSSLVAGPTEEILLVVMLVYALRGAGYSWTVVLTTGAVLRVAFHLYYGWPALLTALWPIAVIMLYKLTGAIWGIIIAHSWFDVVGTFLLQANLVGQDALVNVLSYMKILPVMLGMVVLWCTILRRRRALKAA